jgi:hypothetical protein
MVRERVSVSVRVSVRVSVSVSVMRRLDDREGMETVCANTVIRHLKSSSKN